MKKSALVFAVFVSVSLLVNAKGPYQPGDIANDFSLKNIDGKVVSLSEFENVSGFILVFTCNTCPTAQRYEQRVIDLDRKFSDKGYPVVAINSNDKSVSPGDSFEEMQKLARTKGYKFDYLYDETQKVAKVYGAANTPTVYVLSKDGDNLMVEYVGAIDNNPGDESMANKKYVEDAVNALLSGNAVRVTSTKAIGCTIKWKSL